MITCFYMVSLRICDPDREDSPREARLKEKKAEVAALKGAKALRKEIKRCTTRSI